MSDGRDGNTHLRGEGLVLTADGRGLQRIEPTGWLQAEHTGPGGTQTVVVLPGVGGRPDYVYRVNGVPAAMDAEAHAWFDALIANHP